MTKGVQDLVNDFHPKYNEKYVLVLGSGFHRQVQNCRDNVLTDWGVLIKQISEEKIYNTGSYILDFEQMVLSESFHSINTEKQAYLIEKQLLKRVCKILKKEQEKWLSHDSIYNNFKWLFNNKYVSDVISLNFDLIPEIILSNGENVSPEYLLKNSLSELSNKNKIISTMHRNITNINFWHPHGDINSPYSILLGLRRYGRRITEIEHLRARFKSSEKIHIDENRSYQPSWYDQFVTKPVIILGAGFSDNEWDMLFAFVSKQRNFAKKTNSKFEHPIFKIIAANNSENNNNNNNRDNLFLPIMKNVESVDEQWNALKKILK